MEKGVNKDLIWLLLFLLFMVIFFSFNSLMIFTGKATDQSFNVSVTLSGLNPAEIIYVSEIGDIVPNEENYTSVSFSVYMYDADGVNDLDDYSVNASFNFSDEIVRSSGNPGSCFWVDDLDVYTANYSCSIDMWYWDSNGSWSVNVQGADIGNGSISVNDSTNFNYMYFPALVIDPAYLIFGTLISKTTNQTSTNDPLIINNTGNFNGTIYLNVTDLIGEMDMDYAINSEDFSVGTSTGDENPECAGTVLANNSKVEIVGSIGNRGNLSLGDGSGQEELYYCIPYLKDVIGQIYSTSNSREWGVGFLS